MRGERVQHTHHGQQRLLHQGAILLAFQRRFRQLVHQLHDRRNGGVEGLTATDIVGHFGNSFMYVTTQRLLIFVQRSNVQRRGIALRSVLVDQFPDAFQEAVRPLYAGLLPLKRHIRRGGEHHKQTHGIRAVALYHLLRVDAVVFRLGHLAHAGIDQLMTRRVLRFHDAAFLIAFNDRLFRGDPVTLAVYAHVVESVCQHHALAEQLLRWLIRVHHACITHQFVEEAEVEQVHNGVFDTTNVDIHRQPVVGGVRIQHPLVVLRAGVARIVPGGLHKGVEGVGFTQRWLTVDGGFRPLRIGFDRAGNAIHHHVFRQNNRQLIFRGRQHGAVFQGDHRDGCTPVALTGYAPVAQTEVNLAFADAVSGQLVGNGVKRGFKAQTVKLAGVKQHAFFGQRLGAEIRLAAVGCEDNRLDL